MSYSFGIIPFKYSSLVILVFARGIINYLLGIYSEGFINGTYSTYLGIFFT